MLFSICRNDITGFLILNQSNQSIHINGVDIVQPDLKKGNSVIMGNLATDIVFSPMSQESLPKISENSQVVSYTTRPLIKVFWLGGLLIIMGNLGLLIRSLTKINYWKSWGARMGDRVC